MELKIYDSEHNFADNLTREKDLKIERNLSDGSEVLSFSYLIGSVELKEEMYIRTSGDRKNEYVIKEIDPSNMPSIGVVAKINLEELQKPIQNFSAESSTIDDIANALLDGTGWTANILCETIKKRTISMENTTVIDILDRIREVFLVEMMFDSIEKIVSIKEKFGEDRGVYFIDGINLKSLSPKSDTNDFCTRIIPIGYEGMTIETINDGKNYVENYSYSKKIKTIIWSDNNYEDMNALKEDAEYKLNELCKPKKSYSAVVIDLAKAAPENDEFSYDLGDTVTIASEKYNIRDKQRIVKITEYPDEPLKNSVDLGSTLLSFDDINKAYADAMDTIKNVSKSGIIVGNKVYLPDGTNVVDAINGTNEKIESRVPVEISKTEPDMKYIGMLWKHTGTVPGMISGATYRWNGEKWELYLFAAENIQVNDLAALKATIGGWKIEETELYSESQDNKKVIFCPSGNVLCVFDFSKSESPLFYINDKGELESYDGDTSSTVIKNGYVEVSNSGGLNCKIDGSISMTNGGTEKVLISPEGVIDAFDSMHVNGNTVVHDGRIASTNISVTTSHYGEASFPTAGMKHILSVRSASGAYGVFWNGTNNIRVHDISSSGSTITVVRDTAVTITVTYIPD